MRRVSGSPPSATRKRKRLIPSELTTAKSVPAAAAGNSGHTQGGVGKDGRQTKEANKSGFCLFLLVILENQSWYFQGRPLTSAMVTGEKWEEKEKK